MLPFGLNGVKITLDGDRDTHNRMRPLRGGQGTFDRIVENIRRVAGRVPDRDRRQLRRELGRQLSRRCSTSCSEQEFADKLVKVNFKPIVRDRAAPAAEGHPPADRRSARDGKPLNGTCMTSAGAGGGSACDIVRLPRRQDDVPARGDQAPRLPDARRRAQRPVPRAHAARAHDRPRRLALRLPRVHRRVGAVDRPHRRPAATRGARARASKFERLDPWKECGDCAFIPVCAGGCVAASHSQLGDMNMPTCHKRSFESALISLAHDAASAAA